MIAHRKHDYEHIAAGIETDTNLLPRLALLVPPFALSVAVRPVTSAPIGQELHEVAEALEHLRETDDIPESQKRIPTFVNQIDDRAAVIGACWLWVAEYLEPSDLNNDDTLWLREWLLPTIYWQSQADRTPRPPVKRCYQQAADQALAAFQHPPLPQGMTEGDLAVLAALGGRDGGAVSTGIVSRGGQEGVCVPRAPYWQRNFPATLTGVDRESSRWAETP